MCVLLACRPSAETPHEHVLCGSVFIEPELYRAAYYNSSYPLLLRESNKLEALVGSPHRCALCGRYDATGILYTSTRVFNSDLGELPQVMRV